MINHWLEKVKTDKEKTNKLNKELSEDSEEKRLEEEKEWVLDL
jgi:hypothetical protein